MCSSAAAGLTPARASASRRRSDGDEGGAGAEKEPGPARKEDRSRPGAGRAYFADGKADVAPSATPGGDDASPAPDAGPGPSKKKALPKAADLMSATGTPAFIAHTVAAKQEQSLRVAHVPLQERAVQEEQKKRGLLEIYEEKKRQHKAVSSKYHVPESERDDFVEPVRSRPKRAKETGDIGWLEVFARRSKRSFAPRE